MAGTELLKNMARRLEERGAWSESVAVRAEITGQPDADFWDQFFYARALLYAGRLDEAQQHIIALPNKNEPGVLMLRADLHERISDYTSAEQLWTAALQSGGPA